MDERRSDRSWGSIKNAKQFFVDTTLRIICNLSELKEASTLREEFQKQPIATSWASLIAPWLFPEESDKYIIELTDSTV